MVIFRIIRNLFRILLAAALMPLVVFIRRYASILVILAAGFMIYQCTQSNSPPEGVSAVGTSGKNTQKLPPISPVRKEEDGNSRFATDMIQKMTEQERALYSKHFYWALGQGNPGQHYEWQEHNIAGNITITGVFQNKSGKTCKRFDEVLKVHEIRQTLSGLACAKADGSWCKLRPDSTPVCGLSGNAGWLDNIGGSLKKLF